MFGQREETEIGNDYFAVRIVVENVFRAKIFVNDATGVQIAHALRDLSADVDDSIQIELLLALVKMGVQRIALTVAGYYGQVRRFHASAHEKNQILMSRLSEHGNLRSKRFDGICIVQSVGHVEHFDGHTTVPIALEHGTESADTDLLFVLHLIERYVPLAHGKRVLSRPLSIAGLLVFARCLRILRIQASGQTAIGGRVQWVQSIIVGDRWGNDGLLLLIDLR